MVDNIYKLTNKCPKCGTEVECLYTENIRCVCTKHNCKTEFKKELKGALGLLLFKEKGEYIMCSEENGEKITYNTYEAMEKDLKVLQSQQQMIDDQNKQTKVNE